MTKNQISAKIVADSKNEFGDRITTMQVTFPRFILAELNTHRMMSRNSASSRAIPFEKMLKSVEENPFIPIAWQKDHKGMQGTEYLTGHDAEVSEVMWLEARDNAVETAKNLSDNATTKQLCNRLLEPFMWHTVLITATEWENFFYLRCPKYMLDENGNTCRSIKDWFKNQSRDAEKLSQSLTLDDEQYFRNINKGQAEIHMMALAEAMWDGYNESTPIELKAGEWHIPFYEDFKRGEENAKQLSELVRDGLIKDGWDAQIKIATARCARVSYTVVGEEGKVPNFLNDVKLHDTLALAGHWSPFEHCAKTMSDDEFRSSLHTTPLPDSQGLHTQRGWSGNFRGFIQYRKTFNNENITNQN